MSAPKPLGWLIRQRVPTARLSFRNRDEEIRWLLAFAIVYVFLAGGIGLAIRAQPIPIWGATDFLQDVRYTLVLKIGVLLLLPCVAFWRRGYRPGDLLYGWRPTPRAVAVLALCYAAGFALNLGRVAQVRAAWDAHAAGEAGARATLGVAFAFLNAGIPEELVYRALLQTRLESAWGRAPAILASVALFTAWHLPTRFLLAHGVEGEAGNLGSVLLGTGVPVALVGLVFAVGWDRHRNLPALIAMHGGIDTIPIVASMLQSAAIGRH